MEKKRRKLRKEFVMLMCTIVAAFVMIGMVTLYYQLFAAPLQEPRPTETHGTYDDEEDVKDPKEQENYEDSDGQEQAQTPGTNNNWSLVPMTVDDIIDTGYLQLVNRNHGATELSHNLRTSAWPAVPVRVVDGMYLHGTALAAVAEMFDYVRDTDVGPFFVTSGFRSIDDQIDIYDNGANADFALPPGYSEHHTGLAVDILAVGVDMMALGNTAHGRWLADNSYRFGLILRYPAGAEHITGIQHEPWHFRYIGRIHAYYMHRNNLVLEEYIDLLREKGEITVEKDGVTYHILHQVPENGIILVPDGLEFIISRDNLGGYIVKGW